ncbi:hypothetical protein DFQ03_1706 [Maribacter caenipelagi]|uniref:Copper binding plastocyanin/azurin family protein n=1 Tax=Maribacter caenipelagi TaxID=1447781 RepID=A0A4R7D2Q8_9FLAO|nr:hypothetical protein [Maribacter caenipelagi]TDS15070.1 hypothetical protein DFQ03_1706 [Maribacter caenipelagi]
MKKVLSILVTALAFSFSANAQDKMMKHQPVKKNALEQTTGEFTQKSITVSEGTYIFDIANNNVGKDVGLVLVKKEKDASKPENHIQTAYATSAVKNNTVGHSKETKLEKGEYVYFCPLNPTPQDSLIVE